MSAVADSVYDEIWRLEDRHRDLTAAINEAYERFEEQRATGESGWELSGKAIAAKAAFDELQKRLAEIDATLKPLRDEVMEFQRDEERLKRLSQLRRQAEELASTKAALRSECIETSKQLMESIESAAEKLIEMEVVSKSLSANIRLWKVSKTEMNRLDFKTATFQRLAEELLNDKQHLPTLGTLALLWGLQRYMNDADVAELVEEAKSQLTK